ncbi:hypothetical protein D9M70_501440 [compost metagenome]
MLAGHQHGAAPLAAYRDALHDAQGDQADRCPDAGAGVARQQADAGGGDTHQRHGHQQHFLAAEAVTEVAEHHAGHRPGDEAHSKGAESREGADQGVGTGEEDLAQHQSRGGGVDVEIVEFDCGADECGSRRATWLIGSVHARPFLDYLSRQCSVLAKPVALYGAFRLYRAQAMISQFANSYPPY